MYPDLPYPDELDLAVERPIRDRLIAPFLSRDPLLLVKERSRGPARLLMGLLFVDRPADMLRLGWVTLLSGEGHEHPPAVESGPPAGGSSGGNRPRAV